MEVQVTEFPACGSVCHSMNSSTQAACMPALDEPFRIMRPGRQTIPLVFASPHSGQQYPDQLLVDARLDPLALRRSEDSFVDELFGAAPNLGAPLISANFPRVWCDVNREAWELDPGMFAEPLPPWVNSASPRVQAGLGTLARIVTGGENIYRRKLSFAEAEARIRSCWEPYHTALAALIAETRALFGYCLLIDCHSMPAHPAHLANPPHFVLGDAHGTACTPRATRLVEESLLGLGYKVRRNDPYAGGFVTRHYGRPREAAHALQIEVARSLYMDETRIERLPGFGPLRRDMTGLMEGLARVDWQFLHPSA